MPDSSTKPTKKSPKLVQISTKTGDGGETGLADGRRLPKHSPVFSVLGDLDELNSWLGLCISFMYQQFADQRQVLESVQEQLFYLGAEVASAKDTKLSPRELQKLEKTSEALQQSMAADWTTAFLMPGGSQLGAQLDVARSVCRRAERSLSAYAVEGEVSSAARKYLNRLSDYLYVLRCYINQELSIIEKPFIKK